MVEWHLVLLQSPLFLCSSHGSRVAVGNVDAFSATRMWPRFPARREVLGLVGTGAVLLIRFFWRRSRWSLRWNGAFRVYNNTLRVRVCGFGGRARLCGKHGRGALAFFPLRRRDASTLLAHQRVTDPRKGRRYEAKVD